MKRLSAITAACVLALAMLPIWSAAQSIGQSGVGGVQLHQWSLININNLWYRFSKNGVGRPAEGTSLTYPLRIGNLLYCDNLIWVGKVQDGKGPELRTGGGMYGGEFASGASGNGTLPGAIVTAGKAENPDSPSVRIYRIRPDYSSADLTVDAAGYFGSENSSVTTDMTSALRAQYQQDWNDWPWQKGAPFYDLNHNGVMDAGENPGLQGADQLAWYVYNDLNEDTCKSFYGTPSIGLEAQVTIWAYKDFPNLGDILFKRYRLIYKGTSATPPAAVVDSMYLLAWADPDIGDASNDAGGCDSTLGLGYCYNSTSGTEPVYDDIGVNPGLGYVLLQGPLVRGNGGDKGVFGFALRSGVKNLPMTSFSIHSTGNGDGLNDPPNGTPTSFFWQIARGCKPSDGVTKWRNPDGTPTNFMCAGDPVAKTGWYALSGKSQFPPSLPGDPRIYLNVGPFSMAVGDTQEVVLAVIASHAPTAVENSTWLKNLAGGLHEVYPDLGEYAASLRSVTSVNSSILPYEFILNQNYPNPFNPTTVMEYSIPTSASTSFVIFDLLGREIAVLQDGFQPAGGHVVRWSGLDKEGHPVPSGLYFYRLSQGLSQQTRKMLLLR